MEVGELIEEAVERAGIDPASLTHRHYNSLKRSISLLFTVIEKAIPGAEYRQVETVIAVDQNAGAVEMPADMIDITTVMIVRSDGEELPVRRITREDYTNLNRRTTPGMPSGWWLSKSMPGEVARLPSGASATDNMLLVLWPAMGFANASVRVSYLRQVTAPTTLGGDVDARRENWEVICAGLAARVAEKYNKAVEADLNTKFVALLSIENMDMHPVTIGYRGFGWSRGRRH